MPVLSGRVAQASPLGYARFAVEAVRVWLRKRRHRIEATPRATEYVVIRRPRPAAHAPADDLVKSPQSPRRFFPRALAVLTAVTLGMAWATRDADRSSATMIAPARVQTLYTARGGNERVARAIYPLSVIPGGAYSVEELKAFLQRDPVARRSFEEYAQRIGDPNLIDHLQVRRLTRPVKMFTQLREGSKLFWSSRPVTVQPGESGFFRAPGGELTARSRCGNVMVTTLPERAERRPVPPMAEVPITPKPKQVQVLGEGGTRPFAALPAALPAVSVSPPVPVPPAPPIAPPVIPPAVPPALPPVVPPVVPPPLVPPLPPVVPPTTVVPPIPPTVPSIVPHVPGFPFIPPIPIPIPLGRRTPTPPTPPTPTPPPTPPPIPPPPPPPPAPVPEPTTMLLMLMGLGGAGLVSGFRARRKRR